MGWFRRDRLAPAEAIGEDGLRLLRIEEPPLEVSLSGVDTIVLLRIGETFAMVDEGWWAFVGGDRVIAVRSDCPGFEALVRIGALARAAEAVPDKEIAWLLARPLALRGRDARDGVAVLGRAAFERLTQDAVREKVAHITDLPTSG